MRVLMLHDAAGVGLVLQHYLRRKGHDVDFYYFFDPKIHTVKGDPYVDYGHSLVRYNKSSRISKLGMSVFILKKILRSYDIIHSYASRSARHPIPIDYILMKAIRKKVVIHFHGSGLRTNWNKRSYRLLTANKTVLVSTPDLLEYCPPHATWLPNPVPTEMFPPMSNKPHDKIRILHSCTVKETSPKEAIEKSVEELRRKGYDIELLIIGVDNPVPFRDMPRIYGWSDIVINELHLDSYGIVAVEAMMSQRPVVCHYTWRNVTDPPFAEATPETLTSVLERLIESPKLRRKLGMEGRTWAVETHDAEKITDKLLEIYESL